MRTYPNCMCRTNSNCKSSIRRPSVFPCNFYYIVSTYFWKILFFDSIISSDVEDGFVSPCGVCRQMIAEFGFDIDIYLVNPKNESKKYTMQELLPDAFPADYLKKKHQTDHRCRPRMNFFSIFHYLINNKYTPNLFYFKIKISRNRSIF